MPFELGIAVNFINAIALCVILYIVARHEADYSFSKVFMVAAMLGLTNILLLVLLTQTLRSFVPMAVIPFMLPVPVAFATAWALKTFCWVEWRTAFIATGVFFAFQIAIAIFTASKTQSTFSADVAAEHGEDIMEAAEFVRDAWDHPGSGPPVEAPEPAGGTSATERLFITHGEPDPGPASPSVPLEASGDSGEQLPRSPAEPLRRPGAEVPGPDETESVAEEPEQSASRGEIGPDDVLAMLEAEEWAEAEQHLSVRGIIGTEDSGYAALINGRSVKVGGTVKLARDGRTYLWRVGSITPAGVNFQRVSIRDMASP